MSSRLEWHGDEARKLVEQRAVRFITRAAIEVKRKAQQLLSVPGTGMQTKGGAIVPHRGGKKAKIYGSFPSKPGEPPHKQVGKLRENVNYEIDRKNLTARVGIPETVKYGRYLELGTKRGLAPRPWLRPALASVASRVNELLSQINGNGKG
mgnify:CR=1 FL=1